MNNLTQFNLWLNDLDIKNPDYQMGESAEKHLDSRCKTNGGLGRLEKFIVKLASVQSMLPPDVSKRSCVIFAADHGVAIEGVSKYATPDSAKMVKAIISGTSAVSVLARRGDIPLVCWDVGIASEIKLPEGAVYTLHTAKAANGSANFIDGPALSPEICATAMLSGAEAVRQLPEDTKLIAIGEMGIGNTTAASALTAALLDLPAEKVVGSGAGFANLAHKTEIIKQALQKNLSVTTNTFEKLSAFGGLEIAALAGACLQAAASGICIVLDGFVTATAALAAVQLKPLVAEYLLPSHLAPEPGHKLVLQELGLDPVMDLELRVGEGAGALLLFPLLDAAVFMYENMASFAELGIVTQGEQNVKGHA